jgi:hypothetical protein
MGRAFSMGTGVAGVASALVLALGWTAADAAKPRPGASYHGSSEAGESVTLDVTRRGRALKATVRDVCDGIYVIRGIRIHRDGRFAGEVVGPLGITTLELTGRFVTRRRARGTLDGVSCPPGERSFRARRAGSRHA